jgi:hypothetical protein
MKKISRKIITSLLVNYVTYQLVYLKMLCWVRLYFQFILIILMILMIYGINKTKIMVLFANHLIELNIFKKLTNSLKNLINANKILSLNESSAFLDVRFDRY